MHVVSASLLFLVTASLVAGQEEWNGPQDLFHHRDREKRNIWGTGDYRQCDPDRWPGDKPLPICRDDSRWDCCDPPFFPYDPIRVQIPGTGTIQGRSMIYLPLKYINIFLGVPYARPPWERRRFKPPENPAPGWDQGLTVWDASYYRDACPQEIWKLDERFAEQRNMSEDCLHMNIFAPNETDVPHHKTYPVMVYIHGEDYKLGDSKLYPGHVLAKQEMIVVTFNYRLGALGFLTTESKAAPGNYGLLDILQLLDYIRRIIHLFRGDRNQVTLVGHGSGASAISLLLLSERSRVPYQLFHQVILMSGGDLCEQAVLRPMYHDTPKEYAREFGRQVGCDPHVMTEERFVECLLYKHYEEFANATAMVFRKHGNLAYPFSPVVDGKWLSASERPVLEDYPEKIRENPRREVMKVNMIAGFVKDEGAFLARNQTKNLPGVKMDEGLDPATFKQLVYRMVRNRDLIRNWNEVTNAIVFQYTYWTRPDNRTAVTQELVDLWSDLTIAWCVDAVLKHHASEEGPNAHPVFMYVFHHRSLYEPLPVWMGIPRGRDVDYLFGAPFINETLGNMTGVVPDQWDWTYLDRNISHFIQQMWANFTKYSNPTTEFIRNVSWWPMTTTNLSFLRIEEYSYMDINWRQNYLGFWREYFPRIKGRYPIWWYTTPRPTALPLYAFQASTWSLTGASIITLMIVAGMGITLWRRRRTMHDNYR